MAWKVEVSDDTYVGAYGYMDVGHVGGCMLENGWVSVFVSMDVNHNVKFEKYCADQSDDSRTTRTQVAIEGGTASETLEVKSDEEEKQN